MTSDPRPLEGGLAALANPCSLAPSRGHRRLRLRPAHARSGYGRVLAQVAPGAGQAGPGSQLSDQAKSCPRVQEAREQSGHAGRQPARQAGRKAG